MSRMSRDQRLAAEMAKKHGTSYESASDRAVRKAQPKSRPVHDSPSGQPDLTSAANYVKSTPASAKRRAAHRATPHESPEPSTLRSITAWFRS